MAIVAGSEAHGLPDDAPVDQWVRIEHHGRAESLNVAMATTVLCFEAARARRADRVVSPCPARYRGPLCTHWRDADFGAPGEPGDGELATTAPLPLSPSGAVPTGSRRKDSR